MSRTWWIRALRRNENAVSPVIAVILMVAVTVVMSATVYVWSSGFNQAHDPPARNVAARQDGTHSASATTLEITIVGVSPGLFASYLKLLDSTQGLSFPFSASGGVGTLSIHDDGGASHLTENDYVGAGDVMEIEFAAGAVRVGDTLELVETSSNAVIARYLVR